jgi:hypothetical protein
MFNLLECIFDDKRLACFILSCWLILVLMVFWHLGLLHSGYMQVGPSDTTVFMGVVLDSWYKWGWVALFTFLNTCMNDFMSDAISPWLLNCICDFKTRYLPYPKWQCLFISQTWSIYCNIMSVFSVMISLTQIDFVLIRMVADLFVNTYTNLKFMKKKTIDPHRYCEVEEETSELQEQPKTFTIE